MPSRRSTTTASSTEPEAQLQETPDSSPPADEQDTNKEQDVDELLVDDALAKEEEDARKKNAEQEEQRRKSQAKKRKGPKKKAETKAEREAKAKELDELLMKSAAFSDILTKKTQVLGRVGSGMDGKTLGEHNLHMAAQPKCMVNGTMRDYQLEGLTWMFEICSQGMSGILADEMGLGKTVTVQSIRQG